MKGIISSIIIFIFIACENTDRLEQNLTDKDSIISETSFNIPSLENQFLEELYTHQMNILMNPADPFKINEFISKAYIKENNVLITFGNAALINPQTREQIPRALIKRAAILDAKRWAAYGVNWIKYGPEMQFGKIKEIHQGLNKEIYTFNNGDSLVVALASKVQ